MCTSNKFMTTKEVSKLTGMSAGTLVRYRLDGIGPDFIRVEGRKSIRYDIEAVKSWMQSFTVKTAEASPVDQEPMNESDTIDANTFRMPIPEGN